MICRVKRALGMAGALARSEGCSLGRLWNGARFPVERLRALPGDD